MDKSIDGGAPSRTMSSRRQEGRPGAFAKRMVYTIARLERGKKKRKGKDGQADVRYVCFEPQLQLAKQPATSFLIDGAILVPTRV